MDFMSPSAGVCSQCGYSHPPIPQGTICPMAKHKTESGKEIDLSNFFANMKSIIVANIKMKKIENVKEFTNTIILELNKIIENYKE